ncbi:MAG TPA: polysaccharide deacetylase family protein [Anaerolineales bacterium]|nr:polysaccharide deacetylase family protein [Anaerolineales bacterium]
MPIHQNKKKEKLLQLMLRLGFYKLFQPLLFRSLTVLNYHRIDDPEDDNFATFKPNVSALPAQFDLQMKYLAENYNVVSASDVSAWIMDGRPLPSRAALITFDDGYYDNYANAFPILMKRKLPAIIFLASDYMESSTPFYWDLIAYCFFKSPNNHLEIPLVGSFSWTNEISRDRVAKDVIELIKTIPEQDKMKIIDSFPDLMNVSVSNDLFKGMFLSWDQVQEMSANGIEMGAHTASHPILTRISLDDAKLEIVKSKKRIEEVINKPVVSFAYPNGQLSDYDDAVMDAVRNAGLQAAYTLLPGPTRFATVKKYPYQIRRIFLSSKDTFPRFVGKLSGLSRISS